MEFFGQVNSFDCADEEESLKITVQDLQGCDAEQNETLRHLDERPHHLADGGLHLFCQDLIGYLLKHKILC